MLVRLVQPASASGVSSGRLRESALSVSMRGCCRLWRFGFGYIPLWSTTAPLPPAIIIFSPQQELKIILRSSPSNTQRVSLPHIPITHSAKIGTSWSGSKPSQRDQNVRRRWDRGLLFPPRLCLPERAKYKRLMEWKTLIYRRSNCVIRIVDAHKQIQRHNSVWAPEPWKPVQAGASYRRNTLFTKSSPRRVQRAAVLIVAFVVKESSRWGAQCRWVPNTRDQPHFRPHLPRFQQFKREDCSAPNASWTKNTVLSWLTGPYI